MQINKIEILKEFVNQIPGVKCISGEFKNYWISKINFTTSGE